MISKAFLVCVLSVICCVCSAKSIKEVKDINGVKLRFYYDIYVPYEHQEGQQARALESAFSRSSTCSLTESGTNGFDYQTLNFPSLVTMGTTCTVDKNAPSNNDLVFSKIEINMQASTMDSLQIKDPTYVNTFSGSKVVTHYAVWPLTIKFNAITASGKGFKLIARPVTGLPSPCNGDKVTLTLGETKRVINPLLGHASPKVRCAFLIEAPAGRKVTVKAISNSIGTTERLSVANALPNDGSYSDFRATPFTCFSNIAKVYYVGGETYNRWELEISSI